MRKYIYGILIISFVILNNHFYFFAFNFSNPSEISDFRIMTYNTDGIHWNPEDNKFVIDFLAMVDSLHPHVLVLQEMRQKYSDTLCYELQKRYHYNSLKELELYRLGKKNVACLFSDFSIKSFFRTVYDEHEIDSVYCAYSISDSRKRPLNTEIYNVVIDINGKETLVICCYLKSNNYSLLRHKHSARWVDGLDDYYNGYNFGSGVRSLNAKMIRDSIAKYSLPTIVCGDMNDFQYSSTVKSIMGDELKNVWWEKGFGYGMTYNKYHLMIRIDHILISPEFEAVRVDVPHPRFSDHYPIVADLKFKGN